MLTYGIIIVIIIIIIIILFRWGNILKSKALN